MKSNLYNKILTLLSFVSLAVCFSCTGVSDTEESKFFYRDFSYIVKGIVTDDAGNPIQGIKTVFSGELGDRFIRIDSTLTDAQGRYEMNVFAYIFSQNGMILSFTDVDGEDNGGEFEDCRVNAVFEREYNNPDAPDFWKYMAVNTVVLKKRAE